MPNLTIQGTKVNRVFDAKVEILHDLDEDKKVREAVQVPVMQFTVTLPLDHETQIALWALAPQGAIREYLEHHNTAPQAVRLDRQRGPDPQQSQESLRANL